MKEISTAKLRNLQHKKDLVTNESSLYIF